MTQLAVKFRGKPASPAPLESSDLFEIRESFEVHSPTRSDVPEIAPVTIQEEDIIHLELSDQTLWIGDLSTLEALFPQKIDRSGVQNELFLPDFIELDSEDRNAVKRIGIKLFSVFKKKKEIVQAAVREAAERVENKQLSIAGVFDFQEIGAGVLAHCELDFSLKPISNQSLGRKALLFLHGTGSSTSGSFASLYGEGKNMAWSSIFQSYGAGNVLAFQHRTLTCSPLENVLELVKQLPSEIELDIVTHSRGGLVGDVLARFATDSAGFDKTERGVLANGDRKEDLQNIEAIQKILKGKKIIVRNMVRVACPANGTTLASKRLDHLLNVCLNLIGAATGQAVNPGFQAFRELVMTAVASKNNPDALPGLEAMNPDSPFIKVLNYQGTEIKVNSLLHVVGGSSELSLSFQGLVALAGKLFFRGQNDLVVDTESMKWGTPRLEGKTSIFIDKSKKINHIVYFSTPETQEKIFLGIQEATASTRGGYLPLTSIKRTDQDRGILGLEGGQTIRQKVSGKRPIVILMPGIMGSNLTVNEDMVWINYFRFLSGQLTRLKNEPKNNTQIKAHSLVKTSYGKLADFLGKSYDVVTFPFDWRMSLLESTAILNERILELMKHGQPIKVVAHSMGGVLFRDFILHHEETWKRLNGTSGFRVLFLGSPLGGSYRIPFVLFGQDDIIKLLGKIDISNSLKDLLKVFSQLPGLLNLLPIKVNESDPDFAKVETWEQMRVAFGDSSWPIPSRELLDQFAAYQSVVIEGMRRIDYSNMIYIAGQSRKDKVTITSFEINPDSGKLEFYGTQEGDESVTWASGIPAELLQLKQLYYANVTHGALSTQTSLFGPIEEILATGKASNLAIQLPKLRGNTSEKLLPKSEEIFDLSEENLENILLGIAAHTSDESELPVKVTVAHGDLKYAKFPVLAGHFELDAILTTERVIDRQLGGELTKLLELGLYPGPIGTNQIVLAEASKAFKGAVIVGLGVPGELSAFQLSNSVEKGVSRYLTILNRQFGGGDSNQDPLGITILAIANSYGGLSSDTSIRAVLTGILQANRKVRQTYKGRLRQIEEVEVIELYQDRALSILKSVNRLRENSSGEFNITLEKAGLELKPGRQVRIPFETVSDWWSRITVSQEKADRSGSFPVKMALSTSGASQKVELLKFNTKNLDTLLLEMTELNQARPEIAKTLFELLVPLDFKEELKRQPNISWVVDEVTAAFPWEMLQEDLAAKPLAVNSGMVRQMSTDSYRKAPTSVRGNQVFVIGDPALEGFMPQLAQAAREAGSIADKLQNRGFEVKRRVNSNASGILLDLFASQYKIIHVAAHGVFDGENPDATGIVIGKEAFLTVQEIAQMSTVPELVFVNCCYLGKVEKVTASSREQRNKLAANIGTQLIRNGVKAVVVAGWAVDDQAALEFAETFYDQMFEGCKFGEAVLRARKLIYERYRDHTNTWGAYQCYGDPFYQISQASSSGTGVRELLIKEEAEIELENLVQSLDSKSSDATQVVRYLQELEVHLKKSGIQSEKITERFAELYTKLGDYDRALPYFNLLFGMERANFSLRALEQWCNISCKHAVEVFQAGKQSESERKIALAEVEDAISKLKGLNTFGSTAERQSLLGSAYKRKLMLIVDSKVEDMEGLLKTAAEAYQLAFLIKEGADYYSLVNWIQLLKLQSLLPKTARLSEKKEKLLSYLQQCEDALLAQDIDQSEPWLYFGIPNIKTTRWILEDGKGDVKEIIESYQDVLVKIGAKGHLKAQIEHLDILLKSLRSAQKESAKTLFTKIEALKKGLQEL